MTLRIRPFTPADQLAVIALWDECGLLRPWNDPAKDIARKLAVQPELFLIGELDQEIVASLMAGYDGHRGWLNYLAVAPAHQNHGFASQLVRHAETMLEARGCPKINLQIRLGNAQVAAFYEKMGYQADETISLGKRLIPDRPI